MALNLRQTPQQLHRFLASALRPSRAGAGACYCRLAPPRDVTKHRGGGIATDRGGTIATVLRGPEHAIPPKLLPEELRRLLRTSYGSQERMRSRPRRPFPERPDGRIAVRLDLQVPFLRVLGQLDSGAAMSTNHRTGSDGATKT